MTYHIEELVRQVRNHTITLLKATPEDWLLWAPAGTSNHVLWHAGHALWVQDILGVELITGTSELPDGWAAMFGADCRPVHQTTDWPSREATLELLDGQLGRLLELYRRETDRLAEGNLVERVIHGLHDESRHQGEMYLLLKLCRARNSQ